MYGKKVRLSKIINTENNRTCIVPMDHGATMGPIEGIQDYLGLARQIWSKVDALILHKGLLCNAINCPELSRGRYLLHLSASTVLSDDVTYKVLVGSVEEAVKLGAEGVSVHVNLGVKAESEMIKDLGLVSRACNEWGMPLLAMMYTNKGPEDINSALHAARLAEELGADIVKIGYPGTIEKTRQIVKSVHIPIVVAGGDKMDSMKKLLNMINDALEAGVSGVAMGRNIFQYKKPGLLAGVISDLVHGRITIGEGLANLEEQEELYVRKYIV